MNDPFFENNQKAGQDQDLVYSSGNWSDQLVVETEIPKMNSCLELDVRIKGEFKDEVFGSYVSELIN